ncbi:MAG: DUF1003 domain-containing protein [Halioglobus sp.]
MPHTMKELATKFLKSGYEELSDREKRVLQRLTKRAVISENVNETFHDKLTFGQRLADQVAAFGGSWAFIMIFGATLAAWVLLNTWMLPNRDIFDPYPFIFLNLILSMLAAIQAPVIMMSQNRQTSKDRLAQANDYQVNLKAELEIMNLHEKIDGLRMMELEALIVAQNNDIRNLSVEMAKIVACMSLGDRPM